MKLNDVQKVLGMKQDDLSAIFGIGKAAISAWNRNGIPIIYCARIEKLSEGKISRKDLRPNDWQHIWPELEQQ